MDGSRRGRACLALVLCLALTGCGGADESFMALTSPQSHEPPAGPNGQLSQDQAVRRAADYLSGTDYGQSTVDVLDRIKETQLLTRGSNDCGPIVKPVWAFHIQAPYNGWLYLDAVSGQKACSSLPFLR